jgi:hypothetical protein
MSGEEMIRDFVSRVRGKNDSAEKSIVPIGTPMQQEQAPPPQGQQQPQGFEDGGVVRPRVQQTRVPRLVGEVVYPDFIDTRPKRPPGIGELDGNRSFAGRSPVPPKPPKEEWAGPLLGDGQMWRGPETGSLSDGRWARNQQPVDGLRYDDSDEGGLSAAAAQARFNLAADKPLMSPTDQMLLQGAQGAGDESAQAKSIEELYPLPSELGALKLPDAPVLGAMPTLAGFVEADYKDPRQAFYDEIKANKGKIADARSPYEKAAKGAEKDLEENKRKSFFRAMIQAGVAAMQAGGPSTNPASGDFMSIAGASIGQYVASLDEDKAYQERLKDKITNFEIGAGEAQTRMEDRLGGIGMAAATAENANSQFNAGAENNRNSAAFQGAMMGRGQDANFAASLYGAQTGAAVAEYQVRAAEKLAHTKAALEMRVEAMGSKAGLDSETIQKINGEAEAAARETYTNYMSTFGSEEITDPAALLKIEEAAASKAIAARAASIQAQFRSHGIDVDVQGLIDATKQSSSGMVGLMSVVPDIRNPQAPGTPSLSQPGAPRQAAKPNGAVLGSGYLR